MSDFIPPLLQMHEDIDVETYISFLSVLFTINIVRYLLLHSATK